MTKPTIVTRAGKGSPLTRAELDGNFTNLDNATWNVSDGTNSKAFSLNDTLQFTAGTNISVGVNSSTGVVTITNTSTATGTVTSVSGTGTVNGLTLTGTVTSSGNLTLGGTLNLSSPPTIGGTTPGIIYASQLYATASGSVSLNPANGLVSIQPSGTGTLTINPNTVGTMNKMNIGGTTPGTGAFTTLSANSTVSGTGFSTYLASPPAIGSTTANTGAFTTITASDAYTGTVTTTGNGFNLTYNPTSGVGAAIQATGKDSQGGVGYFDFLKATNTTSGVSNGNKSFRINSTGTLEIINSGYTTTIFSLTDSGLVTLSNLITLKGINEQVYALTFASTLTPAAINGSVQKVTLTGPVTISAFSSPAAGQSITLILVQDATGGRALTSTMKFAGGSKTLSTAGGSIDIMNIFYDGTNYYASLVKGYA